MSINRFFLVLALPVALLVNMDVLHAKDEMLSSMSLKQRLERLESKTNGSGMVLEQMQEMDAVREEISELREMIELQGHAIENITQRQRSLYLDIDKRIYALESGTTTGVVSPIPPPNSGTNTIVENADGDKHGKQRYTRALDLLKEGHYEQSIQALRKFLVDYPQSKFIDNTQYWLGEANYVSREYKTALTEFQILIAKYSESSKIPGAKLKMGYTYYELQNWSAARETLQQVIKTYPGSKEANKAKDRLDRMKREGH